MTLYDTIRRIEDVAASQPAVNMIVRGSVFTLNEYPDNRYGAFVCTQGQHRETLDGVARYTMSLYYVDRVTEGRGNVLEIQSVGVSVLGNIIRTLAEDFGVDEWSTDTFTQRFKDDCAGAFATVTLAVPVGACDERYGVTPYGCTLPGGWKPSATDGQIIVREI